MSDLVTVTEFATANGTCFSCFKIGTQFMLVYSKRTRHACARCTVMTYPSSFRHFIDGKLLKSGMETYLVQIDYPALRCDRCDAAPLTFMVCGNKADAWLCMTCAQEHYPELWLAWVKKRLIDG